MGNNLTEHGRKLAEIKAQKRAAALRENLKKRKGSEAVRAAGKGGLDAKPEDTK